MCNKMSDVRLSNASPTVERVDARHPDNVKPPVRRNLFGRPDPQEIRRCAEAAIQEDVQAFREKYNFDPVSHRPLSPRSGRNYDWKEDSDPPEFYVRPSHARLDLCDDNSSQDAEGTGERRSDRRADSAGSRKRRAGAPGPCSSEGQSKKSRTDDEDDDDEEEDQASGAAKQAVTAAERPSRPDNIAEVQ